MGLKQTHIPRLVAWVSFCTMATPHSKPQVCLWVLIAEQWHSTTPQTSLQPSGSYSNIKGPWYKFLEVHFSSNKIYFPQNEAGYFPLLESDCWVRDESSWLLSDRCQSFICPCSNEIEREPRQWFVSFKEETSARTLFPSDTGAVIILWSAGGDHPSEAGGEFRSLLPKLMHAKQFSSLIHFTQFYVFSSQPTELREGRAGFRCDKAVGTLNDLKDVLEFEDFP